MKNFLVVIILLLTSCVNSPVHNKNVFFKGTFLKIEKRIILSACNPVRQDQCITKTYESSASSFLIKNTKEKSFLLTAAHVCKNNFGKLTYLPKFKAHIKFYGINLKNQKFNYNIVALNNMYDLCIVSTRRMNAPAYQIAAFNPDPGGQIYNIAAPVGIFEKDIVPLFRGLYSGTAHGRSIFSLPATGGSSGSPILDSGGRVIGVVSAVTKGFNHIVLSPTLQQIKEFIKNEKL